MEKALERDGKELNKQQVRVLRWDGQRLINPVFLADLPAGKRFYLFYLFQNFVESVDIAIS